VFGASVIIGDVEEEGVSECNDDNDDEADDDADSDDEGEIDDD